MIHHPGFVRLIGTSATARTSIPGTGVGFDSFGCLHGFDHSEKIWQRRHPSHSPDRCDTKEHAGESKTGEPVLAKLPKRCFAPGPTRSSVPPDELSSEYRMDRGWQPTAI
jgi:hypothetical protein